MNTTTRYITLLIALMVLLLSGSLCFSEEVEMIVVPASETSLSDEPADGDLDLAALDECVMCIEHEDYVMGMDGYYESFAGNRV